MADLRRNSRRAAAEFAGDEEEFVGMAARVVVGGKEEAELGVAVGAATGLKGAAGGVADLSSRVGFLSAAVECRGWSELVRAATRRRRWRTLSEFEEERVGAGCLRGGCGGDLGGGEKLEGSRLAPVVTGKGGGGGCRQDLVGVGRRKQRRSTAEVLGKGGGGGGAWLEMRRRAEDRPEAGVSWSRGELGRWFWVVGVEGSGSGGGGVGISVEEGEERGWRLGENGNSVFFLFLKLIIK